MNRLTDHNKISQSWAACGLRAEALCFQLPTSPQLLSGDQHYLEAGDLLKIAIRGDYSQVALDGSGSNQGVNVPDQPRAMRLSHLPAD